MYTECEGHVHFKTEEVSTHESEIEIVPVQDNSVLEVHLGFLQIRHVYNINLPVSHCLGKDATFDPLENLLVKVKEMTPINTGEL